MATRQLRLKGDEILRKHSRKVEEVNNRLEDLIDDMIDTMYEENGVGLAAPQVGILKRVVVIDIGEGLIVAINPEIISQKGEKIDEEGCLSVPQKSGLVKRPTEVSVKYDIIENSKLVRIDRDVDDYLARVFCHEIDHLDGILYTDKLEEK